MEWSRNVVFGWIALVVLAVACGTPPGSTPEQPDAAPGDPEPDASPPDASPPDASPPASDATVAVTLPPQRSMTSEATLTVRGTTSSSHAVVAVRVGGVEATTSNDFADWRAEVPLTGGINVLALEAEDSLGLVTVDAGSITVKRQATRLSILDLVMDDQTNRLIAYSPQNSALWVVDLATQVHTVLSDATTGAGPALMRPVDLAFDSDDGRVIVLDSDRDELLAVDATTGDRTVLSPDDPLYGPLLASAVEMVIDGAGDRAFVVSPALESIIEVDFATGVRTVVTGPNHGTGAALSLPGDIALDAGNNRLLVENTVLADYSFSRLISVDLATGERQITSTPCCFISAMLTDTPRNRVFLFESSEYDRYSFHLRSLDLTTGEYTVIANVVRGDGIALQSSRDLALDAARNRVLVRDNELYAVVAIDLATGARTIVRGFYTGDGTSLWEAQTAVLAAGGDALLVSVEAPGFPNQLARVDLATGDRTTMARWVSGRAVAWDEPGNRAFVARNSPRRLLEVDLLTGDAGLLVDDSTTGTPPFLNPWDLHFDDAGNRVLIMDPPRDELLAFDLSTFARTVVLDASVLPVDSQQFVYDAPNQRVAVAGSELAMIDLNTSQVTVLASSSAGSGPNVPDEWGVVALDLPRGRAVGSASDADMLLSVDLATRARVELSGPNVGRGPSITRPLTVHVAPQGDLAWLLDRDSGLVAIDLVTGERVTVAR